MANIDKYINNIDTLFKINKLNNINRVNSLFYCQLIIVIHIFDILKSNLIKDKLKHK